MTNPPGVIAHHDVIDPLGVLEALPDALMLVDASGEVCLINAAGRRLGQQAEWNPAPQLGQPFPPDYAAALIAPGAASASLTAALATVLSHGGPDGIVLELLPGTPYAALTIVPFPLRGSTHGALVVQHLNRPSPYAATMREQHEQRMRLESIATLAAGVAHDFNNLLTVMLGAANLALLDHTRPSSTRDALLAIQQAAEHAAELTAQMLAYAGKGRLVSAPVDVNQLAGELSTLARLPTVGFELVLDDQLPQVAADPVLLRRALRHLFANALEAIGTGLGTITASTSLRWIEQARSAAAHPALEPAPGVYVAIAVRDTGAGIEPAVLGRVFEPFFSTKFAGRGLSLAEVLGIAAGHGGCVQVESVPGKGSTFSLLLPVDTTRLAPNRPQVPIAAIPSSPLVLVVDDEEGVRAVIGRILRRAGYRVLPAEDGAHGVELFAQHKTDIACVLLDMTMPRIDGASALAAIWQVQPDARVVLMSGFSEHDLNHRFAAGTPAGMLQKPFTPADLIALVDRITHKDQGVRFGEG
jgi:signal transduction histidine kinase/CheY-like chemotaxis protein